MGFGNGQLHVPCLGPSSRQLTSQARTLTTPAQPLDAIQARARQDRTTVNWHLSDFDLATAGNVAIQADAALVFINSDSGEGYITVDGNAGDRKNLTAWHGGDALVLAVAAQNKNTIVVVHSVGPLIVEPWIDHPNVTAVRRVCGWWMVPNLMLFAGALGWAVGDGDGEFASGRAVRGRESVGTSAIYDREGTERLQRAARARRRGK